MKRNPFSMTILFVFGVSFFLSCNPQMHLVGVGMRKHNLSQNTKKPIQVGKSPNSPFFWFLRNF